MPWVASAALSPWGTSRRRTCPAGQPRLLGEALKVAKIVRLEVHAPAAQVEKLRAPMASLKPQFFVLEEGIRRSSEV